MNRKGIGVLQGIIISLNLLIFLALMYVVLAQIPDLYTAKQQEAQGMFNARVVPEKTLNMKCATHKRAVFDFEAVKTLAQSAEGEEEARTCLRTGREEIWLNFTIPSAEPPDDEHLYKITRGGYVDKLSEFKERGRTASIEYPVTYVTEDGTRTAGRLVIAQ